MRPALVILTKIFPAIKNPPLPGKSARPAGLGRADDIRPYNAPLKNGAPESSRPTHVYFVCFACGETQSSVSFADSSFPKEPCRLRAGRGYPLENGGTFDHLSGECDRLSQIPCGEEFSLIHWG